MGKGFWQFNWKSETSGAQLAAEAERGLVSAEALYSPLVLQLQHRLGYSWAWEIKAPRAQFFT